MTRSGPSGCSPTRSPTPSSKGKALATEQEFTAERIISDETPPEEIPEYTQYVDPRYAEQLMAESIPDEDLPSVSLPRESPVSEPRRPRRVRNPRPKRSSEPAPAEPTFFIDVNGGVRKGIMAEITAQLVKQLRERTGAGMMECKRALEETKGDLAEAEVVLRKRGIAAGDEEGGARHAPGRDRQLHSPRRAARRAGRGQLRVRFRGPHR